MKAELVPYTTRQRDEVEARLSEERNKLELLEERRNGLVIRAYWLRMTNEVSLQLTDEQNNKTYEDIVPNDKVLDAAAHPFAYLRDQL